MNVNLNCDGCNKPQYNQSFTGFKIHNFEKTPVKNVIEAGMPKKVSEKATRQWDLLNDIFQRQENNPIEINLSVINDKLHAWFGNPEINNGASLDSIEQKSSLFKNTVLDFLKRASAKADELQKFYFNESREKALGQIDKAMKN